MHLRILGLQGANSIDLVTRSIAGLTKEQKVEAVLSTELSKSYKENILLNEGISKAEIDAAMAKAKSSAANVTAAATTKTLTTATGGLKASFKGLGAVIKAHPIISMITVATAVISVFNKAKASAEETRQSTLAAASEWKEASNSLSAYEDKIISLREQLSSGTLTESEAYQAKSELLSIQRELSESYGEQVQGIDLVNGSLRKQIGLIDQINQRDANKFLNENKNGIDKATKEMEKERKYYLGSFYDVDGSESHKALKEAIANSQEKYGNLITTKESITPGEILLYFDGDATQAEAVLNDFMTEVRNASDRLGGDNMLDGIFSYAEGSLEEANDVLEKYRDIYEQAQIAEIVGDKNLYTGKNGDQKSAARWMRDYSDAVDKYNEALASGDSTKISEAKTNFDLLNDSVQLLLASDMSGYTDVFTEIYNQLNKAAIGANEFKDAVNGIGTSEQSIEIAKISEELKALNIDDQDFIYAFETEGTQSGEEQINALVQEALELGVISDTSTESLRKLADILIELGIISGAPASGINSTANSIRDMEIKAKGLIDEISAVHDVLKAQQNGKSISFADFNSDELKDYRSALEYVNGTLQLNADKVDELVKKKSEEQVAFNNTNKAIAQSKYLQNAAEIEKLRKDLAGYTDDEAESSKEIKNKIAALQDENSSIREVCSGYDLISASILEATGAYQKWLNSQNGSDYGDMFDSAMSAYKRIADTYSDSSAISGDFGSLKFKAAVDLIVPDTVDKDDLDAVSSYMDSVNRYLYEGDNGMELDIGQFASDAYEKGLMELDESGENYVVAARKTMDDFARELNLSMPVLQAFFDEMQLKGFEFDWADEANKTIGDLAVSADVAAEKLRELNPDLTIELDVSEAENKADALDEKIEQMQNLKIGADAEEIEYANTIISYCVAQKQQLEDPAILNIDTSKLSEDAAEAVLMIQDFKTAYNELELQKSLGLDTTQAEEKVNALSEQLSSSSNDYIVKLKLDTSSADSLNSSIVGLETPEILTTFKIDETALLDYKPDGKEVPVTYKLDSSAVDAYNPENLTRYVNYYVRTFGSVGGGYPARGFSNASGTAMANGSWGTKTGGETLTGELGKEIVINPSTGRWYTVGDNGAEFTNIPKGAIVFNHKQTESLLKYGKVASRGKALASGNAMVTGGGIPVGWKPKYEGSSEANYTQPSSHASNSTSESSYSNSDDTELQKVDWIETAIDRVERAVKRLKSIAESAYKTLSTKLLATRDEIAMVSNELFIQKDAYSRYMQEANSVGLSSDLASLVQSGAIDISEYDEDTKKLIQEYQNWYEAALDCDDAVQQLSEDLAALYENNFNNIQDDFENQLDLLGHLTNSYKASIDLLDASGYMGSTKAYSALKDAELKNIEVLNSELSELKKSMSEAVNSGEIKVHSEAWYSMQNSINEVKENLDDAKLSLVEYNNAMQDLEWGYFDYVQDRISQITNESDFLINLMSSSDLHTDNGQLTDNGMATMGLHGMNYNTYMAQADKYADEIFEINKQLADDPNNTKLIERKEELIGLQQDSILAAEQEKSAIVDLVEEGIKLELDHLKELIDKYNDALDSAKNLYDYQKKIQSHTSEISSLEKQLSAYENDLSEETQAKIQKIQIELKQAKENLEETEYQQYVSDQKKLLDELYLEYETVLNQRLDNVDALIEDMIGTVNANTDSINATLTEVANDVGYTITDNLQNVWNGSTESINGTLSVYGDGFNERLTAINNVLSQIQANVSSMISSSDEQAESDIGGVESTTTPDPNVQPQNPPTHNNQTTPQEKEISVGGKINARGAKIYSYAGDTHGEPQYFSDDPIYTVLGESNGYIMARWHKLSSGITGWFKKNDVKAYKTGGLVDYTGIAQLDGTPSKPELVLNARDTENFIELNNALRKLASRSISMDSNYDNINEPMLTGIIDVTSGLGRVFESSNINHGLSIGDVSVTIPIEHVENYNDFIAQLQKDQRFEKMIQSITIDRLAGKTALGKHSFMFSGK